MKCKSGCDWGGWSLKEGKGGHGVCLWNIRLGLSPFFFWCITFSLGIGTNIQFWVDWWCKDGVLKDALSVLYSIA